MESKYQAAKTSRKLGGRCQPSSTTPHKTTHLHRSSSKGVMGPRAGYIVLFVMVVICTHANARDLVTLDITHTLVDLQVPSKIEDSKALARNEELCRVCQEYTTKVLQFLSETETHSEIITTLHQTCSFLHAFKQKCDSLVDYYAPLLFKEIAKIQPEPFCETLNLCEEVLSVHLQKHDDLCKVCHGLVAEVVTKLEDPDTQLEIIQTLLKGCNKVDNFVQECKKLVFEYGPVILASAGKFVEKTDICAALHLCKADRKVNSLGELFISST